MLGLLAGAYPPALMWCCAHVCLPLAACTCSISEEGLSGRPWTPAMYAFYNGEPGATLDAGVAEMKAAQAAYQAAWGPMY